MLRIFIAFGFAVGQAKRELKHAMGTFYTIRKIIWLHGTVP